MNRSRQKLDDLYVATPTCGLDVDFGFLAAQTANDDELARDVLGLFLEQARRLLPRLPTMSANQQGETAHLLKGSCRGIGAWTAAEAAQLYEDAGAQERALAYPRLVEAFAEAETAIVAHLAML